MKRLISLLIALLVFLSLPLNAAAVTHNGDEYIEFTSGKERIEKDGSFNFKIHKYLYSDNFQTISNQITITASACVYNNNTGASYTSPNITYIIYLYRSDSNTLIDQFPLTANGASVSRTFSVTTGVDHYLKIETSASLGTYEYIKGSGKITNITL